MTDTLSPEERSARMRLIKSKNTGLERAIRKLCRELGYIGYRLNRKDLPGKPDLAFIGKKKAIFVHGCFWHGHNCPMGSRKPKSKQEYWEPKIKRTCERDKAHIAKLEAMGWSTLIVWECELKDTEGVSERLDEFMKHA